MAEVARRAGVSAGTVSLGLRDDPRVKRETRDLIQTVARQMNYRPKTSARALADGRTHTVGVVFADSGPTAHSLAAYAAVLRTITTGLAQRDYFLSLAAWSESYEQPDQPDVSLPRMFRESGIEAVLVVRTPKGPLLEQIFFEQDLPFVMIDAAQAPGRVTVAVNERRTAEQAVEHLVQLGHRRIVYVPHSRPGEAGPYAIPRLSEYPQGYARAMVAAGLMPNPGWDEPLPNRQYEGFLDRLFGEPDPPTSLIVYDVQLATLAISWLLSHGMRVPADVSVVALTPLGVLADGILANMYPTGGVTSRKDMQEQLAEVALEKLMHVMRNPSDGIESVLLEPELVVRGSSGPCSR